jgi:hypothetical protein
MTRSTNLQRRSLIVRASPTLAALALVFGACEKQPEETGEQFTFDEPITWHGHIAPLVLERCGGCHTSDNIGPFSIETYDEARTWAAKMQRDIQSGVMPPWAAQETDECSPPADFKDDLRLTEYEKALFSQ